METIKIFGLVLSNIEQYENLRKSKNVLEHISYHDSLTELHNRAFINKIIEKDFCEPNTTFFNFDIDRLKYVNDTFGHIEGDKLIINTAKLLKKCFRDSDIVARIGGDEFLAILYDCDKPKAEMFRKRIDEVIYNYNCQENQAHLRISLSYGYATSNYDDRSVEKLILKTDELMYSNKSLKRTLM
jgi:diguanylate cyclase (GGDEF)-like protein